MGGLVRVKQDEGGGSIGLGLVDEYWAAILHSHCPFPLNHHADLAMQMGLQSLSLTGAGS